MKEIVSSGYSVWIGKKSLSKLELSSYSKIAILVDQNTKRYCLCKLPKIDNSFIIEIKSGEENKTISTCNFIWKKLTEYQLDRNSLLINLGGGMISDIGGFCAATYKRGIDFIHIPTTLLAMVDAAIGGKLGINFQNLKNQIGVFANPTTVLINPNFLTTLSEKEIKSGYAEIIKHALIHNKNFWKKIKKIDLKNTEWIKIIFDSVKIKNDIILNDFKELGERKKLNFGHTYGHAIESYYLKKKTPILHGEAVLMGIILECKMSKLLETEKNEIKNYILSNYDLPPFPDKNEIIDFLKSDKKNNTEKINFSLLSKIGTCTINNLFYAEEL